MKRMFALACLVLLALSPFVVISAGGWWVWKYVEAHRKPTPEPTLVGASRGEEGHGL